MDAIKPGVNFVETVQQAIGVCDGLSVMNLLYPFYPSLPCITFNVSALSLRPHPATSTRASPRRLRRLDSSRASISRPRTASPSQPSKSSRRCSSTGRRTLTPDALQRLIEFASSSPHEARVWRKAVATWSVPITMISQNSYFDHVFVG